MGSGTQQAARPDWLGDPEAVREFLTVAVHDLREPLRAIRTNSELLVDLCSGSADEAQNRCVGFISDGVDRMETLIRDIAEFCYGELRPLVRAEVDLERVFTETQRQLSAELEKYGVALTHDSLPTLSGDHHALATVLRALIDNALKFRGQADPRIHVTATRRGPEWLFSVRDNGQGFNSAYQERIFNPFEKLNGRRYPGTGLGLAIARRILIHHGGRIWAESQLDHGSTFWFTLPANA